MGPRGTVRYTITDLLFYLFMYLLIHSGVHQFDEPPIVVEIEHLTNLKTGVEYELTQISGFEETKADDHHDDHHGHGHGHH